MSSAPLFAAGRVDTRHFTPLLQVGEAVSGPRGVTVALEHELLQISVLSPRVLRLQISRAGRFDDHPSHAVIAEPPAAADFRFFRSTEAYELQTDELVLRIGRQPFTLDCLRSDGSSVFRSYRDGDGTAHTYAVRNDAFMLWRSARPEDAFYGLGERTGRFNLRGRDFTLWNTDVLNPTATAEFTAGRAAADPRGDRSSSGFDPYYTNIPFFTHVQGDDNAAAGSFLDNPYRGAVDFSRPDAYGLHFSGGHYTEYVFAGPDLATILTDYTELTGRMQRPPLWALGYHQCRWHPYDQHSFPALARRMRAEGIPCDTLWLDIDYMRGYRVFTWNAERFPDPAATLAELRNLGFRTITIIDPGVKAEPGYDMYDEGLARGLFCLTESGEPYIGQVWPGRTAFPDFSLAEARDWWGERNAAHVRFGLAGIWNDMNEPATGDIPPDAMRFQHGSASHGRYHNQYGLLMAMGTHDGLLRALPNERPFILSRAGFAGIQRYAANWLGDNQARWDHLQIACSMALGMGLSGQPFVGADIGGFAGHTGAELMVRWMQYGALTPFCRNHSEAGNVDQYPWSFGPAYADAIRAALELRYRLLAYLHSAFAQSAASGLPVQRPLLLSDQADRTTREIDDQFMLGDHLLVAPISTPGATARNVYLPAGGWYDLRDRQYVDGRRFISAAAPLSSIPLFVRAGAVLPYWPQAGINAESTVAETLELLLFVPQHDGNCRSELHEDDGRSFAYRDGAFLHHQLTVTRSGASVTLTRQVSGADFVGRIRRRFSLHCIGAVVRTALIDGAAVDGTRQVIALDDDFRSVTLTLVD
jgi:alpha-glucosidase